jgi:hypothetical protein
MELTIFRTCNEHIGRSDTRGEFRGSGYERNDLRNQVQSRSDGVEEQGRTVDRRMRMGALEAGSSRSYASCVPGRVGLRR